MLISALDKVAGCTCLGVGCRESSDSQHPGGELKLLVLVPSSVIFGTSQEPDGVVILSGKYFNSIFTMKL
jgi:hypothetical protein